MAETPIVVRGLPSWLNSPNAAIPTGIGIAGKVGAGVLCAYAHRDRSRANVSFFIWLWVLCWIGGAKLVQMMQKVIEQMGSPFSRTSSVLTLECGHLWSWNTADPPPPAIDCIHCDKPDDHWTMDLPGVREMDLAVRNL